VAKTIGLSWRFQSASPGGLDRPQGGENIGPGQLGPAIRPVDWEERAAALAGAALLVNTTPLGQSGQPPLDLGLDALAPATIVNDIVYVPVETPLLAAARAHGNPLVDGLGMLLHPARPAFATSFGVMPEVTPALRQTIAPALR
jgi:shikimate dehydrogenase